MVYYKSRVSCSNVFGWHQTIATSVRNHLQRILPTINCCNTNIHCQTQWNGQSIGICLHFKSNSYFGAKYQSLLLWKLFTILFPANSLPALSDALCQKLYIIFILNIWKTFYVSTLFFILSKFDCNFKQLLILNPLYLLIMEKYQGYTENYRKHFFHWNPSPELWVLSRKCGQSDSYDNTANK